MNVNKEPNHTTIELNDTERAFLFVILEMWLPKSIRACFGTASRPSYSVSLSASRRN